DLASIDSVGRRPMSEGEARAHVVARVLVVARRTALRSGRVQPNGELLAHAELQPHAVAAEVQRLRLAQPRIVDLAAGVIEVERQLEDDPPPTLTDGPFGETRSIDDPLEGCGAAAVDERLRYRIRPYVHRAADRELLERREQIRAVLPVELQQERVMISETLESLVAELELRVRPRAVLPAAALPARTLGAAENAGHDGVRGRHVVIADDGPHVAEVQAPLPGS